MASFIVEGVGPNGVRTWVVIEATDSGDARNKSRQILEEGFTPNISTSADADGVAALTAQSAGFSARFPSNNYTADSIVKELGGAVQVNTTLPPARFEPPYPDGGAGKGVPGMVNPIRGGADAEFGPQFRAGLSDRGITLGGGGGIEGRLAEQARNPFFSRSLASAAFADPSATKETALPSFQDMVRGGALYGGSGAQQAKDLLTQAQGFGRDFTGRGELAGSIVNPSTVSEGSDLANIAREAGRQRFGSFARFLPQANSLSESFFAQPETGASTFADFLSNKIFGA
jgi:hypothetical protein